jgi:hypothetical protein
LWNSPWPKAIHGTIPLSSSDVHRHRFYSSHASKARATATFGSDHEVEWATADPPEAIQELFTAFSRGSNAINVSRRLRIFSGERQFIKPKQTGIIGRIELGLVAMSSSKPSEDLLLRFANDRTSLTTPYLN